MQGAMYASLASRADHVRANRALIAAVRAGSQRFLIKHDVGKFPTLFNERLDLWFLAHSLENRYRNAFGIGDPRGRKALWPSVQLNLAHRPGGARPTARFVRDRRGELWIAHTGQLGGRQPGISRDGFLAFTGKQRTIEIDGRTEPAILLGSPSRADALLLAITELAHAADAYRGAVAAGLS